jgi:hypothetical protein
MAGGVQGIFGIGRAPPDMDRIVDKAPHVRKTYTGPARWTMATAVPKLFRVSRN